MIKHQLFMMVNIQTSHGSYGINMLAVQYEYYQIIKSQSYNLHEIIWTHSTGCICFELPLSPGECCNLYSKHIQRIEFCKPLTIWRDVTYMSENLESLVSCVFRIPWQWDIRKSSTRPDCNLGSRVVGCLGKASWNGTNFTTHEHSALINVVWFE